MLVINRAGTCEHQLSHGFSIKLRQEQLTEDTHVKSSWQKQKSFAQLRKDQENLRKSEWPSNLKRERKRIKMATVHLEILNPNQFGLGSSAGILHSLVYSQSCLRKNGPGDRAGGREQQAGRK